MAAWSRYFALAILVLTARGKPTPAPSSAVQAVRSTLLARVEAADRGLSADEGSRAEIANLINNLCSSAGPEAANPLLAPETLSGRWRLAYTDSPLAFGQDRPAWQRPWGDAHQCIDMAEAPFLLQNQEGPPRFTTATAVLSPVEGSGSNAELTFVELKMFGAWSLPRPPATSSATLEFVYADESMLITRGNRGNTFVLTLQDRTARLPRVRRGGQAYYAGQEYFTGMFNIETVPADNSSPSTVSTTLDNLTPNIKAAGMATGLTVGLTAAFLGANGLLPFQS